MNDYYSQKKHYYCKTHLFLHDKLNFNPVRMWFCPHKTCINEMSLHHTHTMRNNLTEANDRKRERTGKKSQNSYLPRTQVLILTIAAEINDYAHY